MAAAAEESNAVPDRPRDELTLIEERGARPPTIQTHTMSGVDSSENGVAEGIQEASPLPPLSRLADWTLVYRTPGRIVELAVPFELPLPK